MGASNNKFSFFPVNGAILRPQLIENPTFYISEVPTYSFE
jgi:hypothetical protein